MRQSESLQINAQGHLTIGGCDAVELAREYGTPLYVLDETGVRESISVHICISSELIAAPINDAE